MADSKPDKLVVVDQFGRIAAVEKAADPTTKWVISLIAGVLFIAIASPLAFKLVNKLAGLVDLSIASASGCPTLVGLVLHGIVFALIVRGLMEIDLSKY